MSESFFDVVVVGGGPAGACAAAFARLAGQRVLVLEKETFPRFRIGESLLPQANNILRATGVWPKLEAAGFIEKRGALFYTGDGEGEREVIFAHGIVPGLEATFQVERARFDAVLLDHARSLGADVQEGAAAVAVEHDVDEVRVTYRTAGGVQTVRSRWLLDATGRDQLLNFPLKRDLDPPRLERRVAIYTHLTGVERPSGGRAGHTVIVRLETGWFWLIPLDAERTSVGLVTTVDDLRQSGLTPSDYFGREVRRSPRLRLLLAEATPCWEVKVTTDYSYFRRQLADRRVLLLGDAAGFFDPIFSSGVYLALFSAQRAVELITRADRARRPLRPAEARAYTRTLKRHAGVFHRLITAFYNNASFSVFMAPRAPLGLDRGVNAIVAGHSRLTWPVWWRFQLFLLVCVIQRHVALVPRLSLGASSPAGSRQTAREQELQEVESGE